MNVFTQPSASNFRVLDSVPDITQPGANIDQYTTSHIVDAPTVENAGPAMDIPGTNITTQAPKVSIVDNMHLTTSTVASTTTSIVAGDPQTSDPGPSHSGSTVPVTTSTPSVDSATIKALHQKRYQRMEKMKPGTSLTAR